MLDFAAYERGAKESCPIYAYTGLEVIPADDGIFKARVPLTRENGNHLNMMHASVLFLVGEVIGGLVSARWIADKKRFQPVVRDLKIDFKKPALTDIIAEARFDASQGAEMNAKLEETGKYDFDLKAVLTDTNGTVVAETLGAYAIRNFSGVK